MRRLFRYTFLLLVFIVLYKPAGLQGQSFIDDYKKVATNYTKAKKYQINVSYRLYNGNGKEALKTGSGVIKKDGSSLYLNYPDREVLHKDVLSITVDSKRKYLFVTEKTNPVVKQEKHNAPSLDDMTRMIDSIVPHLDKIEYLGQNGDVKSYRLVMPKPAKKTVEISMNVKTSTLKKISIISGDSIKAKEGITVKPRMELVYESTNFKPTFGKDDFAISRFVTKKNDKYSPSGAYKDYKVFYSKLIK